MTGEDDPTLIPHIMKAAKYKGISPCIARACRIPTAADELWMTIHSTTPIKNPRTGFFAFRIKFWNMTESLSGAIELLIV